MSEAKSDLEIAAEIDAMVGDSEQALEILGSLVQAVFPQGPPSSIDQVTWPDEGDRDLATHSPEERARIKLEAAERRFRSLVEQIPAVTFMAVLGHGENEIYVSPHIEQLLGFTQQEWLEDPFLWYWQLHPDDRDLWNREFARGVRTGGPFVAECRFIARDGELKWVHGEARIIKDNVGRPQYLQGIAFDITEQKRAQEITMREAVRKAKLDEEMEIARRVQTSILPRDIRVPGLTIAASMEPAEDVGGDYFDVLPTDDGAWLAIGDVSGHGLNSGLIMMMLQSALAAATAGASPFISPAEVVQTLNRVMHQNIRERLGYDDYVTFSLMRFRRDGTLIQAGAHLDTLVLRAETGRVESLATTGTWLGGRPTIDRLQQTHRLQPGDVAVVYTDGITEARSVSGEMFGPARLIDAIGAADSTDPWVIHDEILKRVRSWMSHLDDDITLLVFRNDGAPTRPGAPSMTIDTDNASYIELSFAPSYALINIVRRFVAMFFEVALDDAVSSDMLAMSVHELLENAVKFSSDGVATIRLEMTPGDEETEVVVITRNLAEKQDLETLAELFKLKSESESPIEFHTQLMEHSTKSDRSQLGIGRVCAEAGMDVEYELEGDNVAVIRATKSVPKTSDSRDQQQ